MTSLGDFDEMKADRDRLRADNVRMRTALKTIFEKSDDIEVCALALGALTNMKPATHEQREQSPEGIAQSKVRSGEWPP